MCLLLERKREFLEGINSTSQNTKGSTFLDGSKIGFIQNHGDRGFDDRVDGKNTLPTWIRKSEEWIHNPT